MKMSHVFGTPNKTRNMLTQWKLTEKCVVPVRNNKNVKFVRGNQNEMKTWSKYQQCGFHLKLHSCAESVIFLRYFF